LKKKEKEKSENLNH